ncbi:gnat family [Moniliophthora roreri MCA 2997]|uniref:Gnat family n=1 Tax=Moniliophthora roreri (strain MCA 2997) TaxID=1381753 RepID=V2XQ35_MONRO|nr:gnat family [Moniliophthora roreri MCA 2997]
MARATSYSNESEIRISMLDYLQNVLNLRACQESDIDLLLKLFNDVSVQRTILVDYAVPRGPKFKEKLEKMAYDAALFVIIETKDKKEFAGFASLDLEHRKHRDSRGDQVYRQLSLGLHRVSLGVLSPNEAAYKLYKTIGSVEEGRLRKAFWLDGEWIDDVRMAISEEGWAALKAYSSS